MTRYLVVAALFILSLITYVDRAAISSAKEPIASELSLSDESIGFVFSAFALGYALAQVPSGWFADRVGPRLALALVVPVWSLFTALTGTVRRFGPLLLVRFLFGIAEAGAFPGSARTFYNWLPVKERGLANGIIFSGTRLGQRCLFRCSHGCSPLTGGASRFIFLEFPGSFGRWAGCSGSGTIHASL
jgi:ACS family glucarate transporter-like MFS transporter